jgi:hypothetical protein
VGRDLPTCFFPHKVPVLAISRSLSRLLQDIAAADMRRSFSDTNLLNLDPSGFDVASMLGPVEEDELLGF